MRQARGIPNFPGRFIGRIGMGPTTDQETTLSRKRMTRRLTHGEYSMAT